MPQVIEIQVLDSQFGTGARKNAGPALAVEREDQFPNLRLCANDVVASPQQWDDLIVAELAPRVFAVTNQNRPVRAVEVFPAQSHDFTGWSETAVDDEVDEIRRQAAGMKPEPAPQALDLIGCRSSVTLVASPDHVHVPQHIAGLDDSGDADGKAPKGASDLQDAAQVREVNGRGDPFDLAVFCDVGYDTVHRQFGRRDIAKVVLDP